MLAVGVPIAMRAYFIPFPTGNTKAVLPALFIGPFTKLADEPEVEVAFVFNVSIFAVVVVTIPFVSVRVPFTLEDVFRFTPALAATVRLLNVVTELPPMFCALVPASVTTNPESINEPLLTKSP